MTMTNTTTRGTVHENLSAGSSEERGDPIMPNMKELQELNYLKIEKLKSLRACTIFMVHSDNKMGPCVRHHSYVHGCNG